jgi:hypothetical protein
MYKKNQQLVSAAVVHARFKPWQPAVFSLALASSEDISGVVSFLQEVVVVMALGEVVAGEVAVVVVVVDIRCATNTLAGSAMHDVCSSCV